LQVKVTDGKVIITLARFAKPRPSKSAKMLMIASTGGWQESLDATVEIDGKEVVVKFMAMAGVSASATKVAKETPEEG